MKNSVAVSTTPVLLVPSGKLYDFIHIEQASGNPVYLDVVDGGAGLTNANGIRIEGEKVFSFVNSVSPSAVFGKGIYGVCASGQSAVVTVQYG